MTRKEIIGVFAGAIAGFGLGAIGWVQHFSPEAMKKASSEAGQLNRLRAENAELHAKLADLSKKLEARQSEITNVPPKPTEPSEPARDALARLKILAEAHRLGVRTNFSVVNPNGELDKTFCELFGLSGEERTALNQTVQNARAALGRLQVANSTKEVLSSGEVVISTHSFPETGGHLYDDTLAQFADTLGSERDAVFVDLCAEDFEKGMDDFGAAERKITVSSDPKKAGWYSVKVESRKPESSSASTSQFNSQAAIAKRVGAVAELLPPTNK